MDKPKCGRCGLTTGTLSAGWFGGRHSDPYECIRHLQDRLAVVEAEADADSSWPIVCRFMEVLGIKPLSWDETTPEQIERAIEMVKQLSSKQAKAELEE